MEGKIIYPELSYKIMGVLFDVHNQLGPRYHEKYYSRATAIGFNRVGLMYVKELAVKVAFRDEIIGKYFLDFLVENKIIVELKAVSRLSKKDINQVLGYLYVKNLRLGILVNFRADSLQYMRILNSKYKNAN